MAAKIAHFLQSKISRLELVVVPLLLHPAFILSEDLVDDRNERVKLGPHRRARPEVSGRNRVLQHLRHRLAVDPKLARRRTLAYPFDIARTPHTAV